MQQRQAGEDPRTPVQRSGDPSPMHVPRLSLPGQSFAPSAGEGEVTARSHRLAGKPGLYYEPVQKLGEGAFGVAHLVRDKRNGVLRVLKTINKKHAQVPQSQLESEIKNMKACDHPHIVRLFEYYDDYENVYLIMERAAGGELQKVIMAQKRQGRYLPDRWVATLMRQCLEAVSYCHSMGIIHKDLKSENILLMRVCNMDDPGCIPHAVLIDLGIAELFSSRLGRRARCTVVAGTPTHMAPEVWMGSFGQVADVWSMGVVLFELLCGQLPFMCSSPNSASEWLRLHRQGPAWPLLAHTTTPARALCTRMLCFDERMRPTATQCLGHAWLKETSVLNAVAVKEPEEDESIPPGNSLAVLTGSEEQNDTRIDDDYNGHSKLEKAVMLQVTAKPHASQLSRIQAVFDSTDSARTGLLSRPSFVSALQELGAKRKQAEAFVATLEGDAADNVEYADFVTGCVALLCEQLRGVLWTVFCVLDQDGNGVLSREEIRSVLSRHELTQHGFSQMSSAAELDAAVAVMDTNHDGLVSFEEVCRFLLPPSRPDGTSELGVAKQHHQDYLASAIAAAADASLQDEEFERLLDHIEEGVAASQLEEGGGLPTADRKETRPESSLTAAELLLAMTPEPNFSVLGSLPLFSESSRLQRIESKEDAQKIPLNVEEELAHLLAGIDV